MMDDRSRHAWLALLLVTVGGAVQAGSMTITARDMAEAPLVLGEPQIRSDGQGEYLCEMCEAYIALSLDGASTLKLTPCLEVRNPFGDRADCVAVDYSFDGASFVPLAAVKSALGKMQDPLVFDKPVTIPVEGKRRVFLRLRVDGSFYPTFTHFRWMMAETQPGAATVAIDTACGKQAIWDAFAAGNPRPALKPAPHVLYLTGPLSLDFGRLIMREPVDGYVFFVLPADWKSETALDLARTYEAMGVPFFVRTQSVEMLDAIFRAAPRTCGGYCFGEAWNNDSFMKDPDFHLAVLETARRQGKKVVWYEHGRDGSYGLGWWGWLLQHPDLFSRVFAPRFRDTLVPLHENNDPRAEMANLGLVLGLWKQGVSREWGASVQTWYWNDAGYGICETCPPELITRMILEDHSLGATWLEIEPPSMFVDEDDRGLPVRTPQWAGIEEAYRLLAEGRARIPRQSEVASLCAMGFVLRPGKSDWSIFDPQPWLWPTPPNYAAKYLYSVERYTDELIPITRCGVVPLFTPDAPVPDGFTAIDTDGMKLAVSMTEMAGRARESRPLFTSPNACVLAWREGRGHRVCLLHPRESGPGQMRAVVETPPGVGVLRDLQTGEAVHVIGGTAGVPLSARRTYRLLEATPS